MSPIAQNQTQWMRKYCEAKKKKKKNRWKNYSLEKTARRETFLNEVNPP